ncbi:MAG: hypothetical protein Q9184_001939 [Pyrenodesmia sp. 2 TL-2023]
MKVLEGSNFKDGIEARPCIKAVLGFCATQVVHKQLLAVRRAREVAPAKALEELPNQVTEDALKLETLDELSRNINDEIRNAAVKIIIQRAKRTPVCGWLLLDLTSKNEDRRNRALTSAKYLQEKEPSCFDLGQPTAFHSITACLCYQLPLSHRFEAAKAKGQTVFRTQPEYDALELLDIFIKRFGVSLAVECNVVSLWFVRYPFGDNWGPKHPDSLVSQLVAKQRAAHDARFERTFLSILAAFESYRRGNQGGVERIPEYGVTDPNAGPEDGNDQQIAPDEWARVWYEIHGTNTAPDRGLGPMMRRNPRAHDESLEEQMLRRRRREAMVLSDMGRPIEREDIIERVDTIDS